MIIDIVKSNFKIIIFGFVFTFFSSIGQSFFIGLFNSNIRAELNIIHGEFGTIYGAATLCSSITLIWLGKKIDELKLVNYSILVTVFLFIAAIFFLVGRYAFSIPILIFLLPLFKLKGLTLLQIFQLFRLLKYLRQTGRFNFTSGTDYSKPSSNLTLEDSYKILGLKQGCSKKEVLLKYKKIMQKIHPDSNQDTDTTKISQIVSEAKETILKKDFS